MNDVAAVGFWAKNPDNHQVAAKRMLILYRVIKIFVILTKLLLKSSNKYCSWLFMPYLVNLPVRWIVHESFSASVSYAVSSLISTEEDVWLIHLVDDGKLGDAGSAIEFVIC